MRYILQSKQFKGIDRFERCLVEDSAHITPGSRGDHVAKIQEALIQLGEGVISVDEIATATYGLSTARLVLGFKSKRKIINRTYQNTPDNIVGKMTIEALDKEMFKLESRPDPNPPPTSRLVSLTMAGAPHDHSKCPSSPFPGPDGRVHHLATPINPRGFKAKINIGGEHETDYLGFRDYTTESIHAGPRNRPLTASLGNNTVSDICLRSSPITPHGEEEIKRIAASNCRLTIATNSFSAYNMEQVALRLGTIIERHYLVDFADSDALGFSIFVLAMPFKAEER